jgi:hypothetical protein
MNENEANIMNETFNRMFQKELRMNNKHFDAYMRTGYSFEVKSSNKETKTSFVYIFNRDKKLANAIEVSTTKVQ